MMFLIVEVKFKKNLLFKFKLINAENLNIWVIDKYSD